MKKGSVTGIFLATDILTDTLINSLIYLYIFYLRYRISVKE
jgi:hypothetical protein